uniref:Uncharacterized protein n=1 Tax=Tanacetum cinerariifolium TaxID=118510 RepID=A0A6L2LLS5_TANCI|nr:hypothetical protein [Tanacetum cinerariifolium]
MLACPHYQNVSKQITRIFGITSTYGSSASLATLLRFSSLASIGTTCSDLWTDLSVDRDLSALENAFPVSSSKLTPSFDLILRAFASLGNDPEHVANLSTYSSKRFNYFCYDDDDDDEDYTAVITPDFSITDSLIKENEHLDTILETKSDEFIKSSVENLVPILSESEDFFDIESEYDMLDCDDSQTTKFSTCSNPFFDNSTSNDDDSSHEEVIHKMSFKTYSNPLFDLDEEIIFSEFNPIHNEDLDSTLKNDCFDTKSYLLESLLNRDTLMASSPKIDSLLEEFFEISSGSTTTHSDSSLYDSFIIDLSVNLFPPADRSDFYEFADELTHIIYPPKYDCVCFKIEPNSGDFTMDVVEDTFPTREPRVHNALPTHPTLQLNLEFIRSSESLFTYVVWIFLHFLLYSVAPQYLLSFGNEDTIFDSGIYNYLFFLLGRMYLIGVELS